MTAMTLPIRPVGTTVGAEVVGIERDQLTRDEIVAAVAEALEAHGALVFRGLDLDPETQVAFCRKLGDVDDSADGHHPTAGIYRVTLDTSKNPRAEYLHGTFHWHIDGCTPAGDECPQMATVLTATAVAERGGDTQFASTYAAHDDLTDWEQERFATLRVVHTLEASQRRVTPDPTERQLARWRSWPASEHPLVWTHRSGRRSLVIGASADHVVGVDPAEGRALLDDLLARATRVEHVYRHRWTVGDTVIWDNRGVLHRAVPYDAGSSREMLRTTVLGDEPIQ